MERFRNRAKTLSWARRVAVRLPDYAGNFPREFWESFPVHRPSSWEPSSWISGPVLMNEAREAGLDNLTNARKAEEMLVNGADTG